MRYTDLKERLWKNVEQNRENLIRTTQKLVSYYTPMGHEGEAQHFVCQSLRDLGFNVDMWEPDINTLKKHPTYYQARSNYSGSPNVVGTLQGAGGGKSLILNAHIDVVPAEFEKWKHGADSGKVLNGRIYGRGSADMKGGCAVYLIAAKSIIESGIKLKGDLLIESVIEEETGGAGTLDTLLRGYHADAAIFTEPTEMQIYPITLGAVWFRLTVPGLATHGAQAYNGVNAIEKSLFLFNKLKEFESKRAIEKNHPLYDYMPVPFCINVGKICAGTWASIVPDSCVMEGRIGISPRESLESAKQDFIGMIKNACDEDEWLKNHPPLIEWHGPSWNAGGVDINHPIVEAVSKSYKELYFREPSIVGAPWPADSTFMNEFGIPAINFGPGEGAEAHQIDESVSIDALLDCTKILTLAIVNWCGYTEQ